MFVDLLRFASFHYVALVFLPLSQLPVFSPRTLLVALVAQATRVAVVAPVVRYSPLSHFENIGTPKEPPSIANPVEENLSRTELLLGLTATKVILLVIVNVLLGVFMVRTVPRCHWASASLAPY